jgi:hypothetical protein
MGCGTSCAIAGFKGLIWALEAYPIVLRRAYGHNPKIYLGFFRYFKCLDALMKNTNFLIFLLLLTFCMYSCKKKDVENIEDKINYTSNIKGDWLWVGSGTAGCQVAKVLDTTVFIENNIIPINDTQLICLGYDTLTYTATDSQVSSFIFEKHSHYSVPSGYSYVSYKEDIRLSFNYITHEMVLNEESSGGRFDCRSSANVHSVVKSADNTYAKNIASIPAIAGIAYDTFQNKEPDSQYKAYNLTVSAPFYVIDKWTIGYRGFHFGDQNILHFKSLDENTKTVVFEGYHWGLVMSLQEGHSLISLTYNYRDNTCVLYNWYGYGGHTRRKMILQ